MSLAKSPHVHYKKRTSDVEIQLILNRIADSLGTDIIVHSGDRDYRPKGSPAKSLHLSHRAVDLHVPGMSDGRVFEWLKSNKAGIFASVVNSYQVIHHGPHTETEKEHVHIGHYPMIRSLMTGTGVTFLKEGMTAAGRGVYKKVL